MLHTMSPLDETTRSKSKPLKQSATLPALAQVDVRCLDPAAGSDNVTVVMLSRHSSLPVLQATLKMPVSELLEEE